MIKKSALYALLLALFFTTHIFSKCKDSILTPKVSIIPIRLIRVNLTITHSLANAKIKINHHVVGKTDSKGEFAKHFPSFQMGCCTIEIIKSKTVLKDAIDIDETGSLRCVGISKKHFHCKFSHSANHS